MKKAKLLPLLALLVLLTVPAQAAGSCAAVPDGGQWRIARYCPGARGGWKLPGFLCPDAPAPGAPNTPAPAVPDAPANTDSPAPNAPANTPAQNAPAPSSAGMSAYELEVVRLTNAERAKYGLAALAADAQLSDGARLKSRDMRDNRYFSHESPTYGSPFQMMKSLGISYRAAGENIAYGYATPEKVVSAWMNSEGHRANILNASYTRIGVGYAAGGDYWTQWFAG
ncbi:MAG: hypothetical protein IKN96_04275 [Oscillibacter sp.]|nr:hypothetical protein [Oscillibacter sp.]